MGDIAVKKRSLLVILLTLSICFASLYGCSGKDQPDPNEITASSTTTDVPINHGTYNNYEYDEYEDHVILTACLTDETVAWLPRTINNKPVTSFGTIFAKNFKLTTIHIYNNFKSVDERAFYMCDHLTSVFFEQGVESIGKEAFSGCADLSSARIPPSVTSIADDAFVYCTNLVIYGEIGSACEEYANRFNSIEFSPTSFSTDEPVAEATSAEDTSVEASSQPLTEAATVTVEATSVAETTTDVIIEEY